MKGTCIACGNSTNRDSRALYCWGCVHNGNNARAAVSHAIKRGVLPSPTLSACCDCGEPATQYDHRDYNKPLEVSPVCRKCNARRGPAKPMIPSAKEPKSKNLAAAMQIPMADWNRINEVMSRIGRKGLMKFINREYRKIKSNDSK